MSAVSRLRFAVTRQLQRNRFQFVKLPYSKCQTNSALLSKKCNLVTETIWHPVDDVALKALDVDVIVVIVVAVLVVVVVVIVIVV